jgi:hypothetical protein
MTEELLPLPPIDSATEPIHSPADLRQRWRAIMGPLGFGERSLWIGFVGVDRRMVKALSQVPLGPRPRRRPVESVLSSLHQVLESFVDGTTIALLLTRPGRGAISDADRHWATLLTEIAAEVDLPIEPIFRANDEAIVLVEPQARAA